MAHDSHHKEKTRGDNPAPLPHEDPRPEWFRARATEARRRGSEFRWAESKHIRSLSGGMMQRGPTTYVNEDHEAREYDHSLVLVRLAGDAKIRPEQNITVVEGLAGEDLEDARGSDWEHDVCDDKDHCHAKLEDVARALEQAPSSSLLAVLNGEAKIRFHLPGIDHDWGDDDEKERDQCYCQHVVVVVRLINTFEARRGNVEIQRGPF